MFDKGCDIDQHPYSDQEIRYENGIPHKLDMIHQWRRRRNTIVQHQSHKEGTQDSLHADKLHQTCAQEDQDHDKYILYHALVIAAEEPARQGWEGQDDEQTQNHITAVMATDYEIENIEKAVDDILQKYEKERLDNRKQEILKQLEIEHDGEKKKQLGKELSNIIIALAKIK